MDVSTSSERQVLRYWRRVPTTVTLAVTVLLVETAGRWLLASTVGLGVRPTGAVAAVAAVLLGPGAAPGVFLGALLAGLVTGGTVPALVGAVGVVAGTAAAGAAATDFGPNASTGVRIWSLRYGFVGSCAVCIVAATSGLLSGLLGLGPFQLVVARFVATNLPFALAVAPVAWYVSRGSGAVGPGPGPADAAPSGNPTTLRFLSSARRRAAAFGIASVGWVVAGYGIGFLFRATERVPAERIGDRLVPAAARFLELVGPRGVLIQGALGVVALSLIVVSVSRHR